MDTFSIWLALPGSEKYRSIKMSAYYSIWLLLGCMSCTPKVIPVVEEDFSAYQDKFTYQREIYNSPEEPSILTVELPFDTTAQHYDITHLLDKSFEYKPVAGSYVSYTKRKFEGWRIQIYRGKSRKEASKVRQRVYELFPNITPYMTYNPPNYKIRVGDFLAPYEYKELLRKLKRKFRMVVPVPSIVTIIIEYKNLN